MFAVTFDIILYTKVHKAMGLNIFGVMVFSCFGIKAMKEALRAFKTVLDFLESSTTSRISCLIVFPTIFEEIRIEPIQAQRFPILHLIHNFTDLLFRHWPIKIVVIFLVEGCTV